MKNVLRNIPLSYALLVLIWGSTWLPIKISIGETPFFMAALRFYLAAMTLVGIQIFRKRAISPPRGYMKVLIALGVGNFFIGYGLTYWGMQFVHSNVTSILWGTFPVTVSICAHFMLPSEKFSGINLVSLLGALFGTYLIFDVQGIQWGSKTEIGMLIILFSILGSAYSTVLYKREASHQDPVSMNLLGMFIGATLMLIWSYFMESWQAIDITLVSAGATLYLAVFGSALAFSVYFWLMRHVKVVKMSYITFLIPILASFWGWTILGENLTPKAILGGAIILVSVTVPERLARRRKTGSVSSFS